MATPQTKEDILNLSDEDLLNVDTSKFDDVSDAGEEEEPEENANSVDDDEDGDDTSSEENTDDGDEGGDEEDSEESESDEESADSAAGAEEADSEDDEDDKETDESSSEDLKDKNTEDDSKSTVDYQAQYEKLTAPFKANGHEMQVNSVDEAITLMQRGANYNKKMSGMKPHLKVLKVLDKNGLLDPGKLDYLIDLNNKNPAAINKLIQESGIDPLAMDAEDSKNYVPTEHTVSDNEIALEQVLDDIQDTPTYGKTINLVSKQWDEPSKHIIGKDPEILRSINDHMSNGIFDVINSELNRQRALGKINGLSDLEAYKQIGDILQAKGGFNHLFPEQLGQQPSKKIVTSKQKVEDPKLNQKRKAASSSKGSPAQKKTPADFNPLSLSDEEFEKQFSNQLPM